jgi:hypothetical protein
VRLWRRRETLNERLLREGGLTGADTEATRPSWDKVGIHGVSRPAAWDEVTTVESGLDAGFARFVVLEDAVVIEDGPDDVDALVDAVALAPPFRVEARRIDNGLWAIGARRVQVATLPDQEGDELELASRDGLKELTVDGSRVFGSVRELERDGDYVVRARRLEGDLFEVDAAPL